MRLPWWGYCGTEMRNGYGLQNYGYNRRYPPGGGTRYYSDPVSGQSYKSCGEPVGAWRGVQANYAVCCNGNTEGRSSQGNTAHLASTFQDPRGMVVGNARYWWNARGGRRQGLSTCSATQFQSNARSRLYNQDADCQTLTPCGNNQYINQPNRNPQSDRTPGNSVCATMSTCNTSTYWANRNRASDTSPQFLNRYVNRECKACPQGFTAAATNAIECACTSCAAGEYQLGECRYNPNGLMNTHMCVPLTTCTQGQFETRAATPTSDRQCTGCRSCPAGSWHVNVCAGEADGVCTPHRSCPVGQYVTRVGTATSDTGCSTCPANTSLSNGACHISTCPANTYLSNGACHPVSPCAGDEHVITPATTTSDQVCKGSGERLPPCESGFFEPEPPAADAQERTCVAISPRCPTHQREIAASTATSDRICQACAPCPAGHFQASPCTSDSPNVCQECAACPAGQQMATPCSQSADRTCVDLVEVDAEDAEPNKIKTVDGRILVGGVDVVAENAFLRATIEEKERAEL